MQSYSFFYPAMHRLSFMVSKTNDSTLRRVINELFRSYPQVILQGSIKKIILKGF